MVRGWGWHDYHGREDYRSAGARFVRAPGGRGHNHTAIGWKCRFVPMNRKRCQSAYLHPGWQSTTQPNSGCQRVRASPMEAVPIKGAFLQDLGNGFHTPRAMVSGLRPESGQRQSLFRFQPVD